MNKYLVVFAILISLLVIQADTLNIRKNVYIIKEGDCLWFIAERFYENPYLWPKIWEANTYIKNPDLIYPNDQLIIPDVDISSEVETVMHKPDPVRIVDEEERMPSEEITEKKIAVEDVPLPIKDTQPVKEEPIPVETTIEPEFVLTEDMPEEIEIIKDIEIPITYDNIILTAGGVVQPDEMESDGYLINFADKHNEYYGAEEIVYLEIYDDVRIGESYLIYRVSDRVRDPFGGVLGNKLEIKGIVTVVELEDELIKGVLKKVFSIIKPGDPIVKYDSQQWFYAPVSSRPEVEEGAIAGMRDHGTQIGKVQDVIYINLGKQDGVGDGQEFLVFKRPKRVRNPRGGAVTKDLEKVGVIRVIKSFDYSSSALIVEIEDIINVGDLIRYDR